MIPFISCLSIYIQTLPKCLPKQWSTSSKQLKYPISPPKSTVLRSSSCIIVVSNNTLSYFKQASIRHFIRSLFINNAVKNSYCWWKKSCTTWDAKDFLNNGINHQPQLVSRISAINSLPHQNPSIWYSFELRHGAPAADKRSRKDSTFSRWPKASCGRWDARWKKMEYFRRCTLWKSNMESKNGGLKNDFPLQKGDFQVPCQCSFPMA